MKLASLVFGISASLTACASKAPADLQCHQVAPPWAVADMEAQIVHRVALDAGTLTFDGTPVTKEELRRSLDEPSWGSQLAPVVAYERNPAQDCRRVKEVRNLMANTLACRQKHCTEVEPPPPKM
jgi:hypothetical protein